MQKEFYVSRRSFWIGILVFCVAFVSLIFQLISAM